MISRDWIETAARWMLPQALIMTLCSGWSSISTAGNQCPHDWSEQVPVFERSIVNIEVFKQVAFEDESRGLWHATGFVVDGERGIIATNAHVTGIGPAQIKVNFLDGTFTEASILYYDAIHDIGFLKVDPAKRRSPLQPVTLESARGLRIGEELLLIGNNDADQYTVKFGTVSNLNVDKGKRYSTYIQTTFDRTGGSSGSAVWNTRGRVVAIHSLGSDTSSFELPADYLIDALKQVRSGSPVHRRDIGLDLSLISCSEAERYFGLPPRIRKDLTAGRGEIPKLMLVTALTIRSQGAIALSPGDILFKADGALLAEDFGRLDRILDSRVGRSVELEVYRDGQRVLVKRVLVKLVVEDVEPLKIRKFVRFAGGTFHDLTPSIRRMFDYSGDGVYLS